MRFALLPICIVTILFIITVPVFAIVEPTCDSIIYHPEVNPNEPTKGDRIEYCNGIEHIYAGLVKEEDEYHWYGNCRQSMEEGNWTYQLDLTECITAAADGCHDSDGGIYYYVYGELYRNGGLIARETCSLIDTICPNAQCAEEMYGQGNYLIEWYFDEQCNQKHEVILCEHGCLEGACLEAPVCEDTDDGYNYNVRGEIYINGVYDSSDNCMNDKELMEMACFEGEVKASGYTCPHGCREGACLEKPAAEPAFGPCTDTDGGIDYFVKGEAWLEGSVDIMKDYCDGNRLSEFYCNELGGISTDYYMCPYGCENGACIQEYRERIPCEDTDGRDYEVQGFTRGHEYPDGRYEGCADYESVYEQYCENNSVKVERYRCPSGRCLDGACVSAEAVPVPYPEPPPPIAEPVIAPSPVGCYDSDGGFDYYTRGHVVDESGARKEDYCMGRELVEYVCKEGRAGDAYYVCPGECRDGACIRTEIWYRYAHWVCYDGSEEERGNPTVCKSPEEWKAEARKYCEGRCSEQTGKCGVNTFGVFEECEPPRVMPVPPPGAPVIAPMPPVPPSECWEVVDPETGLVTIECAAVRVACPVMPPEAKEKCIQEGGDPVYFVDPMGCKFMNCIFEEEGRPFFQPRMCPPEEEIEHVFRKCESMGAKAIIVEEGGCKIARCMAREEVEEACPIITSEMKERAIKECESKGLLVVKGFDERGCAVPVCRAPDECQMEVPPEAFEQCDMRGGKVIIKRDERGCVVFVDCVMRGKEEDVYYEREVKMPETTELLAMAFKLEELKMQFDRLGRKADSIADYYRSVGSGEEEKFRRVADMFRSAAKKVDDIKMKIRDKIDIMTEDDVREIKKDIRYLKDVIMKDILYLMLSGEEIEEEAIDCGNDGECFNRALRICREASFTPPDLDGASVTVDIGGLVDDKCMVKVTSALGGMECRIPDYSLGIENPEEQLFPYCEGPLKAILEGMMGGSE